MYKHQDTIVNTKRTKIAQGIFKHANKQHTQNHTHTHHTHPSLALKIRPVIHINNKKNNQLRKTRQDRTR